MDDISTITAVETGLYGIPNDEALEDATQTFDELELVTAHVETSGGHRGVGFTYTIGRGGSTVKEFLDDVLVPRLEGAPVAPRQVYADLRSETTFVGREGISEFAIAAVDTALWDAKGKETDQPLYGLLGGTQRRVPAYETNGGWIQFSEAELRENARRVADEGFSGMKMKIGRGHAEDARRIRAVREELPEDRDLFVDANCSFTVADARRFTNELDTSIDWLEEPLLKGDYSAYADLRSKVDVPIALGENGYNTTQFKQVLAQDAADFLQPDVSRVGGITPWLTVAETADLWNTPVSPHYVEPVHVHLAAPFENVPFVEHHSTVLNEVVESPLELEDGGFVPPNAPGHGMVFEGLEQYARDAA
ncbi:mandelate racemase/muconate lactonizing enzyme family protein [Halococcus agarilyticus]|uniref:mandelate racemase/muconate lactonizing enzyme family protein n=1 Tax=Halococcus agarilyticus TaxID=1232219 RepID=UPI0006777D19|nr:mandelate racemase/muconate lactonizing enzyme family protein [Halococcus agarilyticus]